MTTATNKTYRIANSNGLTGPAWGLDYSTQEAAAEAIRRAFGWDDVVLSDSYSTDEGDTVSAYSSQDQYDADQDGAYAPRIVAVADCGVSDAQIEALRTEAGNADDLEQVDLCDRALSGMLLARRRCARVIEAARAMADA